METRQTTPLEKKVFKFLDKLRNSGAVNNMFGARPYIVNVFGIEKQEATSLLTLWLDNFNEEGNYETVKTK